MREVLTEGEVSGAGARWVRPLVLLCVLVFYASLQLWDLGHPLFWQDEGETAMFGQRVLEYGYPKVHSQNGVVYGIGVPMAEAVDSETDAYLGSFWGQYYLAALGVGLSEGATDPYVRTAWVRAPFVLLGLVGLGLLWWAIQPALADRRGARLDSAIVFGLLLCVSISLMLHLKEARYYGPTLALIGAGVAFQFRIWSQSRENDGGRAWMHVFGSLCLLLLLLNFFFPAALALAGWWAIERLRVFYTEPRAAWSRFKIGWPLWLSLSLWGLASLALMQGFGINRTAGILSDRWDFGFSLYLENLGHLAYFLLRYEWLIPCLVIEATLWGLKSRGSDPGENEVAPLAARWALYRLCLLYALVGAANPIFFERYFVPLGPILALVLVIDLEVLRRRIAQSEADARKRTWARGALILATVVCLGLVWLRLPELKGRFSEIQSPVAGPVDAAVLFVNSQASDPSALTIATNYEAESLMFYLGAQVVGRFHPGTPEEHAREARMRPDLVIPRRDQPRSLRAVRRYLLEGEFERIELPVADSEYNNIPELYPGRVLSSVHRFETLEPGASAPPLAIYQRVDKP